MNESFCVVIIWHYSVQQKRALRGSLEFDIRLHLKGLSIGRVHPHIVRCDRAEARPVSSDAYTVVFNYSKRIT